MKKKDWMKRILVTALCIMLVVSLVRIQSLQEQLERETGYLQSQIQSLESRLNSIYNNVDEMLEKEASLLTFSEWKITSLDVDEEKANVAVTITPKEYRDGATEAVLLVGSQEHVMTMKDGSYRAETEVPLFDTCEIEKVVFQDGSQIRTEYLGWSIFPRYELPDVYADFSGSLSGGTKGNGEISMWSDGEIRVHIKSKDETAEIKSVHMVTLLDGTVQERTAVPADGTGEYTMECKESYKAPFGSRFEIAAEVVDQYGLVYRSIVHRWESDRDGNLIDDMGWFGNSTAIYNQEGELLFYE